MLGRKLLILSGGGGLGEEWVRCAGEGVVIMCRPTPSRACNTEGKLFLESLLCFSDIQTSRILESKRNELPVKILQTDRQTAAH